MNRNRKTRRVVLAVGAALLVAALFAAAAFAVDSTSFKVVRSKWPWTTTASKGREPT